MEKNLHFLAKKNADMCVCVCVCLKQNKKPIIWNSTIPYSLSMKYLKDVE